MKGKWDGSVRLGSTSIELSCLIPAIELATQLKMKAKEGTSSGPGTPTPLKLSHVALCTRYDDKEDESERV